MLTALHTDTLAYTGHQLRSHWIFETFGLQGDAIVAFRGPCQVALSEMVDRADVFADEAIEAAEMLHFIAEHFDHDLNRAVLRQRLFICMISERLAREPGGPNLRREGDDLYVGDRKLSVSIATVSPVSTLMHVGLNVDGTGAPVATAEIGEFGIDPHDLARELLKDYSTEMDDIYLATCKVRGVQ
ncbi:MAG: DUF366 family protein [candidate division WS1 bacterium]|nr:DUF366 family protein [candidate division WS1 bacterium]